MLRLSLQRFVTRARPLYRVWGRFEDVLREQKSPCPNGPPCPPSFARQAPGGLACECVRTLRGLAAVSSTILQRHLAMRLALAREAARSMHCSLCLVAKFHDVAPE